MKTDVLGQAGPNAQPDRVGLKPRLFWRMGEPLPVKLDRRLRIISVVVPLVLWWIVSSLGLINPTFFPLAGRCYKSVWRAFRTRGQRGCFLGRCASQHYAGGHWLFAGGGGVGAGRDCDGCIRLC